MLKLLKSNLREICLLLVILPLMLYALHLLGGKQVAESGLLSTILSLFITILGGVLKFAVVLALMWFGMAVTFPEGNNFIIGTSFDDWWGSTPAKSKGYIVLVFAGILGIIAAICMAV